MTPFAGSITSYVSSSRGQSGDGHPAFANPPMLVSQDGKLHVDVVGAPAVYTIAGHAFQGMLYNGQYIPPVWRFHRGDKVTVTLHNQLTEPTNLHFHGLGVSPEEWTILNQDTQYHDFHIHQTRFLVTEVKGAPTQFDLLRDTFRVPPMQNGKPGRPNSSSRSRILRLSAASSFIAT